MDEEIPKDPMAEDSHVPEQGDRPQAVSGESGAEIPVTSPSGADDKNTKSSEEVEPEEVKFSAPDPSFYRDIGFYLSADEQTPPAALHLEAENISNWEKNRHNEVEEWYRLAIGRIEERVSSVNGQLELEELNLKGYGAEIDAIRLSKVDSETELERRKRTVRERYEELARAKADHIKKKAQALTEELTILMDAKTKMAEGEGRLRAELKKQGGLESTRNRTEWLTNLQKQLQGRYDNLSGLLKELDLTGASSPTIVNAMISLGYLGVVATGWFFSVFIYSISIIDSGKDPLPKSFWEAFLLNLGKALGSGQKDPSFMVAFAYLAAFLLLLLGIGFLSQMALNKLRERIGNHSNPRHSHGMKLKLRFRTDQLNGLSLNGWVVANNWSEFMLQLAPAIAVLFTMVAIMTLNSETAGAFNVATGSTIGVAIVLGLTALAFVYVSGRFTDRFIEKEDQANVPDAADSKEEKTAKLTKRTYSASDLRIRLRRDVLVVGLAFIGFNLLLVIMALAWPLDQVLTPKMVRFIALGEFTFLSVVLAVALAYLHCYRAILGKLCDLRDKLSDVSLKLDMLDREPIDEIINDETRESMNSLFNRLYQLMNDGYRSLEEMFKAQKATTNNGNEKMGWWARLKRLVNGEQPKVQTDEGRQVRDLDSYYNLFPRIQPWEEQHFPTEVGLIRSAIEACFDIELHIRALRNEILGYDHRNSWKWHSFYDRINALREELYQLSRNKSTERTKADALKQEATSHALRLRRELLEGSELGRHWYRPFTKLNPQAQ